MAARAADEIEMLREGLMLARSLYEDLEANFQKVYTCGLLACDKAEEAQRECCRLMAEADGGTPEEHAHERGWECFKENA